jgi:hypothetical protein
VIPKERWQTQDEEDEHRRLLLARASKGDVKAQRELMQAYGARVYSEKEKSRLVYENVKTTRSSTGASRKRKGSQEITKEEK